MQAPAQKPEKIPERIVVFAVRLDYNIRKDKLCCLLV
jgi:hypothetical protein